LLGGKMRRVRAVCLPASRRVKGWDLEFESGLLQRRVFANLTRSIRSPKILPSELRAASVIRVYVARAVSWRGQAAGFGVSPTTDWSCAEPSPIKSPTTISPVAIPTRAWSLYGSPEISGHECLQHAHDSGCRNPEHPQQYNADRQRHVGRAPPESVRFGRGCFGGLAGRRGSAPNRFQRYRRARASQNRAALRSEAFFTLRPLLRPWRPSLGHPAAHRREAPARL
jgi:hypothetical protein